MEPLSIPAEPGALAIPTFSWFYLPSESDHPWRLNRRQAKDALTFSEHKRLPDHSITPEQLIISLPSSRPSDQPLFQNPPVLQWSDSDSQLIVYSHERATAIATITAKDLETDFFIIGDLLAGSIKNGMPAIYTVSSDLNPSLSTFQDPLLRMLLLLLGSGSMVYCFTSEEGEVIYVFIDRDGQHHLISRDQLQRAISLFSFGMIERLYSEVFGQPPGACNSDAPEDWKRQMRTIPPDILGLLKRLMEEHRERQLLQLLEQFSSFGKQSPKDNTSKGKKTKKKTHKQEPPSDQALQSPPPQGERAEAGAVRHKKSCSRLAARTAIQSRKPFDETELIDFQTSLDNLLECSGTLKRLRWENIARGYDIAFVIIINCLLKLKSFYFHPLDSARQALVQHSLSLPSGTPPDDLLEKLASPVLTAIEKLLACYYKTLLDAQERIARKETGSIPSPFYYFEFLKAVCQLSQFFTNVKYQSFFSKSDFRPILAATNGLLISLASNANQQPRLEISSKDFQGKQETKIAEYVASSFPSLRHTEIKLVKSVIGIVSITYWQKTLLKANSVSLNTEQLIHAVRGLLHSISASISLGFYDDTSSGLDQLLNSHQLGQDLPTLVQQTPSLANTCNHAFQDCLQVVMEHAPLCIDSRSPQSIMTLFEDFVFSIEKVLQSLEGIPETQTLLAPCTGQLKTAKELLQEVQKEKELTADSIAAELEEEEQHEKIAMAEAARERLPDVQRLISSSFHAPATDQLETSTDTSRSGNHLLASRASEWEVHMHEAHKEYQLDNLDSALNHLHKAINSTRDAESLFKSYCEQFLMQAQKLEHLINEYRIHKRRLQKTDDLIAGIAVAEARNILDNTLPETPIKEKEVRLKKGNIVLIPLDQQAQYYQQALILTGAIGRYAALLKDIEASLELLVFQFDHTPRPAIDELSSHLTEVITQIEADQLWLSTSIKGITRTLITLDLLENQLGRSVHKHKAQRYMLKQQCIALGKEVTLSKEIWQTIRRKLEQRKTE